MTLYFVRGELSLHAKYRAHCGFTSVIRTLFIRRMEIHDWGEPHGDDCVQYYIIEECGGAVVFKFVLIPVFVNKGGDACFPRSRGSGSNVAFKEFRTVCRDQVPIL